MAPSAPSLSSGRSTGDRALIAVEVAVGIAVVAALVGQTYGAASTVIFLLACLAAAFSLYALVRMVASIRDPMLEIASRTEDEQRDALEHEKLLILQGIKELEADAAVGKVDSADYKHLRATAEARALSIIEDIRTADARYAQKAADLVAKRLGHSVEASEAPRAVAQTASSPAEDWSAEDKSRRAQRAVWAAVFPSDTTTLKEVDGNSTCSSCEFATPEESKFCAGCGRAVKEAA